MDNTRNTVNTQIIVTVPGNAGIKQRALRQYYIMDTNMEPIIQVNVFQWLSQNILTKILFTCVFFGLSIGLYSISRHSRDKDFFKKNYRYDYNAFRIYFFNTSCYLLTKAFKLIFYVGFVLLIACLFLNSSITYWVFVIFSVLIIVVTFLRLVINFKEKTIFLLPKWKHPDKDTRYQAVKELTSERTLQKVMMTDSHLDIRKLALGRIKSQAILEQVALHNNDYSLRTLAVKEINNQQILEQIALNDKHSDVRDAAVLKISNREILAKIVLTDEAVYVRRTALEKIDDPEVLLKVAANDTFIGLVSAASLKLANLEDKRAIPYLIKSLGARADKDRAADYEEHFSIIRSEAAKALQFLLKNYPELDTSEMNQKVFSATYSQYTEHHDSSWECRD